MLVSRKELPDPSSNEERMNEEKITTFAVYAVNDLENKKSINIFLFEE